MKSRQPIPSSFSSDITFLLSSLVIFLTIDTISTSYIEHETDHLALLSFKSMITRDPYGALTSWNTSFHFCDWSGVSCGKRHRRVTGVRLISQGLEGSLSPHVGNLSFLHVFVLMNNGFQGTIPHELGRLSRLRLLNLESNKFNGVIPSNLSSSSNLGTLSLAHNNLTGSLPIEIFQGTLTKLIGNLSHRLRYLNLAGNQLYGNLPSSIGNLVGLESLNLGANRFTGLIPSIMGKLQKLQIVDLGENKFCGPIPDAIGNLSLLIELNLNDNKLEGNIPSSLGNCHLLLKLDLSNNKLSGKIPRQLFQLSFLSIGLDLSHNNLSGSLTEDIEYLTMLSYLDLSYNNLSGPIPSRLGVCNSLSFLFLTSNLFEGIIPDSLSGLRGLVKLDLSHNKLSGIIPRFLEFFQLEYVDLSFNDFEGEGPVQGVFANASTFSYLGNSRLCGGLVKLGLPKCKETRKHKKEHPMFMEVILIACSLLIVLCFLYAWFHKKNKGREFKPVLCSIYSWCKQSKVQPSEPITMNEQFMKVSYNQLFKATYGFSKANLIGEGGFSSVYIGILNDDGDKIVAVKVLHLQNRGAHRSFIAECEAWRSIRHRNILKIITSCSSVDFEGNDFKALVYEFMPYGSLHDWLHSSSSISRLNLLQRMNILIDIASALDYLHNHCLTPVVHGDLKPSNILLDCNMMAHVGDFGLARFLGMDSNQNSSNGIKLTIGYAPPEYGIGNEITSSGDVYSFGILLLEVMTGKKPTDHIFNERVNLHKFASIALPENVTDIIDGDLVTFQREDAICIQGRVENAKKTEECLTLCINIGVSCSLDFPPHRMKIENVVHELQLIRDKLQNI